MILVVGGAGYIGCCLCKILAERSEEFIIYDKLLYNQDRPNQLLLGERGRFIHGDIFDQQLIDLARR